MDKAIHFTKDAWRNKAYSFFCHKACEAFPCHKDIPLSDFNCLFCYCPLYFLGEDCGGDYVYLSGGIKDCSHCTFPHRRENYGEMMVRLQQAIRCKKEK